MRSLDEALRAALAGRYDIERELGRGGMAVVYLARDLRHSRRVAIKVMLPELTREIGTDRFLREIGIAARLAHPHILPLLDSGESGGILYYVMPYVDGETLRDRLERDRQLPIAEALALARQIASALDYAHAQGIVHRDIKPENILLIGDDVLVADFGLARALYSVSSTPLTQSGMALGTPVYMSPEQAAGDPNVDARSDVYSLGCVLFELIAGVPPFRGATVQALIAHHISTPAPSLCRERSSCPQALDAAVQRALAKLPADRFRTAGELVRAAEEPVERRISSTPAAPRPSWRQFFHALGAPRDGGAGQPVATPGRRRTRVVGAALLGGMLLLAGAGELAHSRRAPTAAPAQAVSGLVDRRVAVAPFENRTGDSALALLGRLTSDWVTQGLAEADVGEVVDPQTVAFAWHSAPNVGAFAAATGARLIISGAFYSEGDSLRLLARITDAHDGQVLRAIKPVAVSAARVREGVALLRERTVSAVAGLLDADASVAMSPSMSLPPSLTAYQHWSTAIEYFSRNAFREAIPEFLAAAKMDSTFVAPLGWAAMCYTALGDGDRADSLLRIAARGRERLPPLERYYFDANLAEHHGDWAGALRAARQATRLAAGSPTPPLLVGWDAIRLNRPREAIEALTSIDPERPPVRGYAPYWEQLTQAQHEIGDFEAELAAARRGRRAHPEYAPLFYDEARALAALGRVDEAERQLDALEALQPDPLYTVGELMWLLGREFRTHRQEAAAQATFSRALAWYDARPAAERATPASRGRRAEVLYAAGRWDEARRIFEALAKEHPGTPNPVGDLGSLGLAPLGDVDYLGYLGALAARRGDRKAALAADSTLAAMSQPRLLGRHAFWRARIAALLGDPERAIALLREALQQGRTYLVVHAEADFASLRDLPAFQELVRPQG